MTPVPKDGPILDSRPAKTCRTQANNELLTILPKAFLTEVSRKKSIIVKYIRILLHCIKRFTSNLSMN